MPPLRDTKCLYRRGPHYIACAIQVARASQARQGSQAPLVLPATLASQEPQACLTASLWGSMFDSVQKVLKSCCIAYFCPFSHLLVLYCRFHWCKWRHWLHRRHWGHWFHRYAKEWHRLVLLHIEFMKPSIFKLCQMQPNSQFKVLLAARRNHWLYWRHGNHRLHWRHRLHR